MSETRRHYQGISGLRETDDVGIANKLLDENWELLAIKQETLFAKEGDGIASVNSPVYILGWPWGRELLERISKKGAGTRE